MSNVKRTVLPALGNTSYLTDEEVDHICDGYVQNAAKTRFLTAIGLTVHTKPNGRPLVARKQFDSAVCSGPALQLNSQPKWRLA